MGDAPKAARQKPNQVKVRVPGDGSCDEMITFKVWYLKC
jgi:hypothetical protein